MKDKYNITNAELEIMQVLWDNGSCRLIEIITELDKIKKRNKNTVKTLIYRLVDKGTVNSQKNNSQETVYFSTITEREYLARANNSFLKNIYKGNIHKLLLNFIEDKTVSKDELKRLVDILERED